MVTSMATRAAALVLLAAAVAGCSGGAESRSLSCPYPDEVSCESLSSVYERTAGDSVQLPPAPAPVKESTAAWPAVLPPRVLRVWLAPWQDADGDLHGAQEIYMLLEEARWRKNLRSPDANQ